jgi:signal transduction histidine kinase
MEISERKKAEMALKEKNEQLIRINDDLDTFVYTASHDLKSPISNIEGLIVSLNEELTDINEESKLIIDMINQSILKFKDTINDLAEITKAQKNLEEDISLIDLGKLIEEIIFSIKDMIVASKANIQYDGQSFPSVKFSKANLKSIIYNLLNNAIKYRHPERTPEILIACRIDGEYLIFSIKDNGLGINSSQKNKIFTMFKRFHDHVEGSGIGLYLVKRIIDNCGGKIEVDSIEGEGCTFNVFLKVKEGGSL